MDQEHLESLVTSLGFPPYRARQIHHWLYRHGASSLKEMTNLPAALVKALEAHSFVIGAAPPLSVEESTDGTRKYLFPTAHGGFVEAALIPEDSRVTLCLSTQVGCRRSCVFCQTARQGFQGNLDPREIVNQYHAIPERERITNIVFMGMGEPLDNWENTCTALKILTDTRGYALPARRVTLSTVGVHPQLESFFQADTGPISLAISLHNPFPEERRRLMPVENLNPMEETVRLIRQRREDRARRISFEYTLFAGVNDTARHVAGIARLLNGLRVRINLIPYHRIDGIQLTPTPPDGIEQFAEMLRAKGFPASIRRSRGQDINAACGLLWTRHAAAHPDRLTVDAGIQTQTPSDAKAASANAPMSPSTR